MIRAPRKRLHRISATPAVAVGASGWAGMYLIDTDILIYLMKGHDAVRMRFEQHARQPKAISLITYGELYYGALKSRRIEANLARVGHFCGQFPVLDVSRVTVETFAAIKTKLEHQGTPLDDFDLLIAATALETGFTLVTNNERHFLRIEGLEIDNWSR